MAWERDPGFRGRTPERLTESPNLALGREAGIRGLPRLPTADARSIRVVACLSQQTIKAQKGRVTWECGSTSRTPEPQSWERARGVAIRGDRSSACCPGRPAMSRSVKGPAGPARCVALSAHAVLGLLTHVLSRPLKKGHGGGFARPESAGAAVSASCPPRALPEPRGPLRLPAPGWRADGLARKDRRKPPGAPSPRAPRPSSEVLAQLKMRQNWHVGRTGSLPGPPRSSFHGREGGGGGGRGGETWLPARGRQALP